MNTPDVKTINEIIDKELKGEPCTDGNCRGCIIQRSFSQSREFRDWLDNIFTSGERDLMMIALHIAALSFQVGEQFQKKQRELQ
jgi:hypothetical protein